MERSDNLRTLALRISPEQPELIHRFFTLEVPPHWKTVLSELQAMAHGRDRDKSTIPYAGLNKVLRALVPDLIFIESYAWGARQKPWLYAAEPVNPDAIHIIVRAWIQTLFTDLSEPSRAAISELRADDLRWQMQTIDLASWGIADNGTAIPQSPHTFRVLPDLLAAKISRPGVELHIGSEPLRFRRAPLEPGIPGAELISWPPRIETINGKDWPFSVILTLSVQTVPFQPFPVVHCNVGVRRWAGPTMKTVPGGNTSVYLLTSVPWITGVQYSESFQAAPMRWVPLRDPEKINSKPSFQLVWDNNLTQILNKLRPGDGFLAPQEIREDPLRALQGNPSAAIVYRNSMEPKHGVQPGLPPKDRMELTEQLGSLLQPETAWTDPLPRVRTGNFVGNTSRAFAAPNTSQDVDDVRSQMTERRQIVRRSVGDHIHLDIRYQSAAVCDALTGAIRSCFGLAPDTTFPHKCDETGLTIHVHAEQLGPIGSGLIISGKGRTRDQLHAAIRQRCELVMAQVQPASAPTGALIELANRQDYERDNYKGLTDPKHALRKAFAHTRRLTQFISTPRDGDDDSLEHRAMKSVLDLLRQFGVQEPLPSPPKNRFSGPINYVGLWLIKEYAGSSATRVQEMLPVMVHVEGDTGQVRAIALGMKEWLPYREVLMMVARGEVRGVQQDKDALPFIQKMLSRDLSEGNTLLLCHAQNLRQTWPWLGNTKLSLDKLALYENEVPQPIALRRGLRVLRVRDSDGNETPQSYAPRDDDSVSYISGLFAVGDRVFMGVNPKPSQFKHSRHMSKLSPWVNAEGTAHSPTTSKSTPNSTLLEIAAVCLQTGDDPVTWASIANRIRNVAVHHDEATALPLPLHLAQQMKEYVLPLIEDDEGQ